MDREDDVRSEVIELGEASVETKGPNGPVTDFALGRIQAGLADE
jgi:hypothetical protein